MSTVKMRISAKPVNDLVMSFLFTGMPVSTSDSDSSAIDSVVDAVRVIIDEHSRDIHAAIQKYEKAKDPENPEAMEAMEVLTYDLLPVRNKILYEAYAPYWLLHCRSVKVYDRSSEFTYYNDLIDMYWAWKRQSWMSKDGSTTVMLPPTRGLIALAYKTAAATLENFNKKAISKTQQQQYRCGLRGNIIHSIKKSSIK